MAEAQGKPRMVPLLLLEEEPQLLALHPGRIAHEFPDQLQCRPGNRGSEQAPQRRPDELRVESSWMRPVNIVAMSGTPFEKSPLDMAGYFRLMEQAAGTVSPS